MYCLSNMRKYINCISNKDKLEILVRYGSTAFHGSCSSSSYRGV